MLLAACNQHKGKNDICKGTLDSLLGKEVFIFVDTMPTFVSDKDGMLEFFRKNFKPTSQVQMSVNIVYVVDDDGLVKAARVPGKNQNDWSVFERELIDFFENMPRWNPGSCLGKKVPVVMVFPLRY